MKNKYEIRGEVTSIFLNRRFAEPLETIIDTNHLSMVDSVSSSWFSKWDSHTKGFYVVTNVYDQVKKKQSLIYLHRFLMETPDNYYTDHISGNTLDNRRSNLRNCSNAENCYNRKSRLNSSSRFKGVMWKNREKKWCARIVVSGKRIELGLFTDEMQAAKTYNQAAIQYHGEFARLNQIS